jgi:RNA polymerase sigma-70 factor, ECF subfamily
LESQGLEQTDGELVARARVGDLGAFDVLVDRHVDGFYGMAFHMVSRREDAEDVVQETLLAVHQGLERFEGRSSFKTWATGILMRQASLCLRRRPKKMGSLEGVEDSGAGKQTRAADARMDLAGMLAKVSEEHREVLVLREIQGLSYDEIAEVLKVPRGTVESRLFRARAELKKGLGSKV